MNDRLVGKHCGIVFSFLRSNEETKTWMRRSRLLVTVETSWLWGHSAHNYSAWIIKCIELRIRTTLTAQRSNLLYTLFDMFQEKSQRSATEDNSVKSFVFGTRTGLIMRMAFFHCSETVGRILPGRWPDDSHGVVTGSSQPGTHRALYLTC